MGGTLAEPVRPCDDRWPRRSLVVVQGQPTDPEPNAANQLAIALLDRGSADLVLVGNDWQRDLAQLRRHQLHPRLNRLTQLLVFLPPHATPPGDIDWLGPWALISADYPAAVEALRFDGLRQLETMDAMNRIDGKGAIWLHGGPEKEPDPKTGLTWVHLCPGTFTMGTSDADPEAAVKMKKSDEFPHRVSLSAFEITETEITNAQYRRLQPDHDPRTAPKQPAANITWQQARDFCRGIGGDLPTEAQWEYAARAGSRSPWSFGADAARLDAYAWYADNANNVQAVGQKSPNPWGLYDMHGNAWEWVRDAFGDYSKTPQLDPMRGSGEGPWRVVRGGSFGYSPQDLRSALRFRFRPELRRRLSGFRCVRVPARPFQ